jgi:hypothetical protein
MILRSRHDGIVATAVLTDFAQDGVKGVVLPDCFFQGICAQIDAKVFSQCFGKEL